MRMSYFNCILCTFMYKQMSQFCFSYSDVENGIFAKLWRFGVMQPRTRSWLAEEVVFKSLIGWTVGDPRYPTSEQLPGSSVPIDTQGEREWCLHSRIVRSLYIFLVAHTRPMMELLAENVFERYNRPTFSSDDELTLWKCVWTS